MSNPDRLILVARLRMLGRSLREVRDSLATVERQRKVMRDLLPKIPDETYDNLDQIDAAVGRIRTSVRKARQGLLGSEDLGLVDDLTDEIRKRLMTEGTSRGPVSSESVPALALEEDFLAEIAAKLKVVDQLQKDVKAARTPAEVGRIWVEERKIFKDSQQFFAEYVDLLTGLALRDSGFDNGISQIADALIRKRLTGRYLLTILGHKQREVTQAQFIHLGFPEWTPWALPLAAFDVGRLELRRGGLPDFIADAVADGFRRSDVEDCLADAIATYLIGPAYVWAATVIQFDPGADKQDRLSFSRRLMAMLAVLRSMDTIASDTTFRDIANDVEAAWARALSEVGDDAVADIDEAPNGTGPGDWRDGVERHVARRRLEAVEAVISSLKTAPTMTPFAAVSPELEAVWNAALVDAPDGPDNANHLSSGREISAAEAAGWLDALSNHHHRAMTREDWTDVDEVAKQLMASIGIAQTSSSSTEEQGPDATNASSPPVVGDDLRVVLNAGWLVRIEQELDMSSDDGPLDLLGRRVSRQLGILAGPQDEDSPLRKGGLATQLGGPQ